MRTYLAPTLPGPASAGLLLVRLVVGLAFVFHGYPKIMNPTGWMGPNAFAPEWLQAVAAVAEFAGGIAIMIGFLTRLAALALVADMLVAIVMVHVPQGAPFVGMGPGHPASLELPLTYAAVMVLLVLAGAGTLSVDGSLARARKTRVETVDVATRPLTSH
ncbi:MAG: DoxX family protein [Candidatus Eremiobacteraeota bacterium]|nr:DoxX family protein [Candidatus Eremiobacteraeota bacterium]